MTVSISRSPELVEAVRLVVDYELEDVYTSLPGRVESYDPEQQKADVKPLVQRLIQDENGNDVLEPLPVIPDVPVAFLVSNSFGVTFPLEEGDLVVLWFQKSSIDNFLASDGNVDVSPDEFRRHDLSDAVAYPGIQVFDRIKARAESDQMVMGSNSGKGVLYFAEGSISAGAKDAGDAAALESKVQAELSAIQSTLSSLVTAFNTHVHSGVLVGMASSGPPVATATPPAAVNPTNSDVLKLDS